MRRPHLFLLAGTLFGTLLTSVVSVYLIHDVDRGQADHLNAAFAGLCLESILFAMILTVVSSSITALGVSVFGWQGYTPRLRPALWAGFCVAVLQYPLNYLVRSVIPKFGENFLHTYLAVAPLVCAAVLLVDIFKQKKQRDAWQAASGL